MPRSSLMPHQLGPARFLSQNPRGHVLMYMEMGSGKSAALGACIRARNLDAVIVVPAIVVSGMCLELEAWLGFRREGGAPPRSVKHVLRLPSASSRRAYVVTHTSFPAFMETPLGRQLMARGDFLLAYDESQGLRNVGHFHKTRALHDFAQTARNVALMTGTPMYKDVRDAYAQLFILGALGAPYDELSSEILSEFEADVNRDPHAFFRRVQRQLARSNVGVFYHKNDPAAFATFVDVVHAHRPTAAMVRRYAQLCDATTAPGEVWTAAALADCDLETLRRHCRAAGESARGGKAALVARLDGKGPKPKQQPERGKASTHDQYTDMKKTSNMSGGRAARKLEAMCDYISALPASQTPVLVMAPYGHIDAKYGGVDLVARRLRDDGRKRVRSLCGTKSAEERARIVAEFMAGAVDVIVTNLSEGYSLSCRLPGTAAAYSRGGRPLRQVHTASPNGPPGERDQLKARGNRLHSHDCLPKSQRVIEVHHWVTCHARDEEVLPLVFADAKAIHIEGALAPAQSKGRLNGQPHQSKPKGKEGGGKSPPKSSSKPSKRQKVEVDLSPDRARTYDINTLLRSSERRAAIERVEEAIRDTIGRRA